MCVFETQYPGFLVTQYAMKGISTNLSDFFGFMFCQRCLQISHLDHIYIADHIPLNSPDLCTFQLDESSQISTQAKPLKVCWLLAVSMKQVKLGFTRACRSIEELGKKWLKTR